MCAGVQNESRPIVWCQEMSHVIPTQMQVAANTISEHGQGMRGWTAAARAKAGTSIRLETALAMVFIMEVQGSAIRPNLKLKMCARRRRGRNLTPAPKKAPRDCLESRVYAALSARISPTA